MEIYSNTTSLHNLQRHIIDKNIWIRYKACRTLHYLVSNRSGADAIIKAGFLPFLLKRLLHEERDIIVVILEILRQLLHLDVKQVTCHLGALPVLIRFVFDKFYDVSSFSQDCLELLLTDNSVRGVIDDKTLAFLKNMRYNMDRETCLKSLAVYKLLSNSTFLRNRIILPEIIDHILNIAERFKSENQIVLDCFTILHKMCDVAFGRRILERRKFLIINVFLPNDKPALPASFDTKK
ncbi:hypothetical protein L9F63_015794 [Diploptera punctata]|uniref:Uncharacterized protein n=1 Tax=Diploptera punctata TaxID=6984 RepID=A0AAD8A4Y3_DIPPU|nr:hypothetical protein L9F63_015794 [Diploptera punctata]